jgi:plasmid stability protein
VAARNAPCDDKAAMPDKRSYTEDEVREILDQALQKERDRHLDHDQLLSVASEIGLEREAIETAVGEVQEQRARQEAEQRALARRRRSLALHAAVFAVVHVLLFAVNYLTSPGQWWVLFPAVFWGLALLAHAAFAALWRPPTGATASEARRVRPQPVTATRQVRVNARADDDAVLEEDDVVTGKQSINEK